MRAARVSALGRPIALTSVADPVPGRDESLVRIDAAVIGHLDLTIASGSFGIKPAVPYTPGVEGAGTILASAAYAPGSRVAIRGAGVGMQRDGCWAEMVAVPDRALRPVPDQMAPEIAAGYFVPLVTAYVALHDVGRFVPPEPVLVTGASGAVGAAVVGFALDAGAERVVAVVGRDAHATTVLADERVEVVVDAGAKLPSIIGSDCPALAVDTVGGETLAAVLQAVPPGGRVAALGYTRGTELILHLPDFLLRDVELRPVNGIRREPRGRTLIAHLARMLDAERVSLAIERFDLDDLPAALDRLASGDAVGRVVVLPAGLA